MHIYYNSSIKDFSYIKIGGIVKQIIIASTEEELIKGYLLSKPNVVVGNTSKILFAFDYLDKSIIIDHNAYIKEINNQIVVGSGTLLSKIGLYYQEKGYKGFEYIRTIPGRLGGSIVQNASFNKESIADNIISVTFLENNKIITKNKEELMFSYRNSYFKTHDGLILHACLKKEKQDKKINQEKFLDALSLRANQPKNITTLGSIFLNVGKDKVGFILNDLKGFSLTKGVSLSKKHANFLEIKKECAFQEILLLISTLYIVLYKRVRRFFPLEIILIKGGD